MVVLRSAWTLAPFISKSYGAAGENFLFFTTPLSVLCERMDEYIYHGYKNDVINLLRLILKFLNMNISETKELPLCTSRLFMHVFNELYQREYR